MNEYFSDYVLAILAEHKLADARREVQQDRLAQSVVAYRSSASRRDLQPERWWAAGSPIRLVLERWLGWLRVISVVVSKER